MGFCALAIRVYPCEYIDWTLYVVSPEIVFANRPHRSLSAPIREGSGRRSSSLMLKAAMDLLYGRAWHELTLTIRN